MRAIDEELDSANKARRRGCAGALPSLTVAPPRPPRSS